MPELSFVELPVVELLPELLVPVVELLPELLVPVVELSVVELSVVELLPELLVPELESKKLPELSFVELPELESKKLSELSNTEMTQDLVSKVEDMSLVDTTHELKIVELVLEELPTKLKVLELTIDKLPSDSYDELVVVEITVIPKSKAQSNFSTEILNIFDVLNMTPTETEAFPKIPIDISKFVHITSTDDKVEELPKKYIVIKFLEKTLKSIKQCFNKL